MHGLGRAQACMMDGSCYSPRGAVDGRGMVVCHRWLQLQVLQVCPPKALLLRKRDTGRKVACMFNLVKAAMSRVRCKVPCALQGQVSMDHLMQATRMKTTWEAALAEAAASRTMQGW